ncbi:ABC transporter permease [Populibacterium corticicola]|uniref:ABC transporter permease n=1 Tax=Populibacterium corticicola TaxID=1812826 RepID=A0ABW5XL31_9MICO
MLRYVTKRVAQAIIVVWAAYTLTFVILYLLPSDPVSIMLNQSQDGHVDEALAERLRAEYGFDQSTLTQYANLLGRAIQGDFGTSIANGARVSDLIAQVFPETLKLAGLAFLFTILGGTALAVASIATANKRLQQFLLALPPLGVSVPGFWIGLILLQVFSFTFPVFPAIGNDGFKSLVLPALTLAIPLSAMVAQVLADSLHSTWREPYVETARAKGLTRWQAITRHTFKNAAVPALTITGMLVGGLFAGSVVVETVFSRAGFGRLVQTSVQAQDIPVIQGFVVLAAVIFVAVNLLVDVLYPLLDPRIRSANLALAA